LKPVSDIESAKLEKVTDSYYKLPEEFPTPISSGRYKHQMYSDTLNDDYCCWTIGTENFKFKIRNQNEEALFKNEDEMYEIDFGIIKYENTLSNIRKEQANLAKVEHPADGVQDYQPIYLTNNNYTVIQEFYTGWESKIMQAIRESPDTAFKLIIANHLEKEVAKWREAKREHQANWKSQTESNFSKSLDHL